MIVPVLKRLKRSAKSQGLTYVFIAIFLAFCFLYLTEVLTIAYVDPRVLRRIAAREKILCEEENKAISETKKEAEFLDEFKLVLKRQRLFENNPETFNYSRNHTKNLVYVCSSAADCGDWGTRLMSILQGFILAIISRRNFQICMPDFCSLERFYETKYYNWKCGFPELQKNQTNNLNNLTFITDSTAIVGRVLQSRSEENYFYRTKNSFYGDMVLTSHYKKVFDKKSEAWVYHVLYKTIFSPGQIVSDFLQSVLDKNEDRIQTVALDTSDNRQIQNFIWSNVMLYVFWAANLTPDVIIHGNYNRTEPVYLSSLTSDRFTFKQVKRAAEKTDKVNFLDLPGEAGDLSKPDHKCSNIMKAVFSFEVAILSDVLVISHSKQAYMAGLIRGTGVGLYCLNYARMSPQAKADFFIMDYCPQTDIRKHFQTQFDILRYNYSVPVDFKNV